jgi:hypothetical protein
VPSCWNVAVLSSAPGRKLTDTVMSGFLIAPAGIVPGYYTANARMIATGISSTCSSPGFRS